MTVLNNYKGFDLFNDIGDGTLKARNRGVVMANISEDHTKNRKISPKGAGLVLGYFFAIPAEERKAAQDAFVINMNSRGFALESKTNQS